MPPTIKIIVVDDHPLVLKGFMSLLDDHPDIAIIGKAGNGKELLELLTVMSDTKPDIVILDIEMPVMNGIDAMKHIQRDLPEIKVILMSFHTEATYVYDCMAQGAGAYITKGSDLELITQTIHHVYKNGYFYDQQVMSGLFGQARKKRENSETKKLSEREREILKLICEGYMNKEIAALLNIYIGTVDFHKKNISRKTGFKSKADLIFYAIKHNIFLKNGSEREVRS